MKTDFGWDLPPGVSANDIPGNRAEDIKLDTEYDELTGIVYDQIEELLESLRTSLEISMNIYKKNMCKKFYGM